LLKGAKQNTDKKKIPKNEDCLFPSNFPGYAFVKILELWINEEEYLLSSLLEALNSWELHKHTHTHTHTQTQPPPYTNTQHTHI
jgi:hypothetical protein